jgi:hypothetical protein
MATSPSRARKISSLCPEPYVKGISEEKVQGVLENIFGLKIPDASKFESEENHHYSGLLENVFGVRLPSEMVTRAYTIFIKEYKS